MASLGARIASGGSAELFELGAGRVIKLFRSEYAHIADARKSARAR